MKKLKNNLKTLKLNKFIISKVENTNSIIGGTGNACVTVISDDPFNPKCKLSKEIC